MTWSTLKLVPIDDDDKSLVKCVASNAHFPADSREQQITLTVHCTSIYENFNIIPNVLYRFKTIFNFPSFFFLYRSA